jgi:hypothetical protein
VTASVVFLFSFMLIIPPYMYVFPGFPKTSLYFLLQYSNFAIKSQGKNRNIEIFFCFLEKS